MVSNLERMIVLVQSGPHLQIRNWCTVVTVAVSRRLSSLRMCPGVLKKMMMEIILVATVDGIKVVLMIRT